MNLTKDNFILYASKYYDTKKSSSYEEFLDDMKRFQYIKRLFKRYEENGELKARLILNHIIILYNCFGVNATPMLFFKLENYHSLLKPFISKIEYLPLIIEYDSKSILTDRILSDQKIEQALNKI